MNARRSRRAASLRVAVAIAGAVGPVSPHAVLGEEPPVRFEPPFRLHSGDWSVQTSGRLQFDAGAHSAPVDGARDTFEVRRARLGFAIDYQDRYKLEINGNFTQVDAALDTGYLDMAVWQAIRLRAGKFKMPFSLEELTSASNTSFLERSLGNAFVPGKQTGLMLHGKSAAGLVYGLALSNGNTDSRRDSDSGKALVGRVAYDFSGLLTRTDSVIHLGVSRARESQKDAGAALESRTEGRGLKFFETHALDTAVDISSWGLEAAWAKGSYKVQGEWLRMRHEGSDPSGAEFDRDIDARYVEATWLISGERYPETYKDGGFGRVKPRSAFNGKNQWGALEVGLRHSRFDGSDYSTANSPGTGVLRAGRAASAYAHTLGVKWIHNEHVRFMFNLVRTSFRTAVTLDQHTTSRELTAVFRAQMHF